MRAIAKPKSVLRLKPPKGKEKVIPGAHLSEKTKQDPKYHEMMNEWLDETSKGLNAFEMWLAQKRQYIAEKQAHESLKIAYEYLTGSNQQLQLDLKEAAKVEEDYNELVGVNQELRDVLDVEEAKVKTLTAKNDGLHDQIERIQGKLNERDGELSKLREEGATSGATKATIDSLKEACEKAEREKRDAITAMNQAQSSENHIRNEAERFKSQFQSQLQQYQNLAQQHASTGTAHQNALLSEQNSHNNTRNLLQAEKSAHGSTSAAHNRLVSEKQALTKQIEQSKDAAEKEKATLQQEITKLKQDLLRATPENLRLEIETLKNEKETIREEGREALSQQHDDWYKLLKQTEKDLDGNAEVLRGQLEKAEKAHKDLDALGAKEAEQLHNKISTLESDVRKKEETIWFKGNTISRLEKELSDLKVPKLSQSLTFKWKNGDGMKQEVPGSFPSSIGDDEVITFDCFKFFSNILFSKGTFWSVVIFALLLFLVNAFQNFIQTIIEINTLNGGLTGYPGMVARHSPYISGQSIYS